MSAERVVTARELNRALLARQLLLDPGAGSVAQTPERVGGLQAQYAPSRPAASAGAWRHVGGRIELDPFRRLDRATRRALREEADRLAALHV